MTEKNKEIRGKSAILITLVGVLLISSLAFYGRWTLFIPYGWVVASRPLIWAGTTVLIVLIFSVRLVTRRDASTGLPVAAVVVVVLLFAVLFGFLMREVLIGGAALVNSMTSRSTSICVELEDSRSNPGGFFERTQYAWLRVENSFSSELRYMPSLIDMSALESGGKFELNVFSGPFGYTVLGKQQVGRECIDRPQPEP